jgi:hypothetical protein
MLPSMTLRKVKEYTMVASQKSKPKKMSLPVNPEIRQMAEEVLQAGEYGTITNALRVSLRNQLANLRAARQPATSAA